MYDGEIRIDTRIDESGFNKGIKNISAKMKTVAGNLLQTFAKSVLWVTIIAQALTTIVFMIGRMARQMYRAMNMLGRFGNQTEAIKESVQRLRNSFFSAFAPLIITALPAIQAVVDWLTRMVNIVSMIMALLRGQNTILVANATAVQDAAGSSGKMAKNIKEGEKAAKGALAAFDEINVLQMEEPDDGGGGGGGGGGGIGLTEIPIDNKITEWFQRLLDFIEPLIEPLKELWQSLTDLWDAASIAMQPLFDWLGAEGSTLLEWIRDLAVDGIEWLTERIKELTEWIQNNEEAFRTIMIVLGLVALAFLLILSPAALVVAIILGIIALAAVIHHHWDGIKEFFQELWEKVKTFFSDAWEKIKVMVSGAWEYVKYIWGVVATWFNDTVIKPVVKFFTTLWDDISKLAETAWGLIKKVWDVVFPWFSENVLEPVKEAFATAFQWISDKIETIFTGVKDIIKGVFNTVIDLINGMLSGAISGINTLIDTMNRVGTNIPGWKIIPQLVAPQIPRLASGAVIPPNSQFLAVLGDQRSGRNLEAPEGLIRQIIREEMGDMGGKEVTINFAGSLGALVRELKPYIDKENNRKGTSFAAGGAR